MSGKEFVGVVCIVISAIAGWEIGNHFLGQRVPNQLNQQTGKLVAEKATLGETGYGLEPVTVNLPPGQKFLYIIHPRGQSLSVQQVARGNDVYVTAGRAVGELPKKITIWGPGSSPGTWKPILYIQEN